MINRFAICLSLVFWAVVLAWSAVAQEPDFASLAHPDVAGRLSLTDSQRAQLQSLLQSRAETIAAAADNAAKEKAKADFKEKILAVLNAEQQAKFKEAPASKRLMFQFREMKWDNVLDWFAGQQDLTLVMDQIPPGTFTYSDTRSYSPSEGIDLLNSVLMTRNFTLVRREKMLVVMALSDSIPLELLPRVKLDELVQRGRFELVSVLFPTDGRPIDTVLQEVKPFLSTYGRIVPLAQGTQVLVVETAGKMLTINEIIASVPLPKAAPKSGEPAPKPVFASYPLGNLDAARALETVRKLIPSDQITVDAKAGVMSAFLVPDQHIAVKASIDQMIASTAQLPSFESVAYPLPTATTAEEYKRLIASLEKQIQSIAPNASVSSTTDRILVIARAEDQRLIKTSLGALEMFPIEGVAKSMKVFELEPAILAPAETALKAFLPKGQIASNSKAGSLLVRGTEEDVRIASEMIEIFKRSQSATQLQMRVFPLPQLADAKWLATMQRIVPAANAWLGEDGRQLILLAVPSDLHYCRKNVAAIVLRRLTKSRRSQIAILRSYEKSAFASKQPIGLAPDSQGHQGCRWQQ